jgi:hypothetical protein
MTRFRDVKDVTVHGNSWTGVQEITFPIEAENFDYSGDDDTNIQRVDVTKQSVNLSIVVQDPAFKRDILDPKFGASPLLALNEVLSISLSETGDEIPDSSEDDDWIAFVGITKKVCEAEVELRDIEQILTAGSLKIGDLGQLQFDVMPGAALTGLADRTAYERFFCQDMTVVGINPSLRHGDLASGTVSFRGGSAGIENVVSPVDNPTVFEIAVGDVGSISFVAPDAATGSAGDFTTTIANCVCTSVELQATHGGRLERRFNFRAYSSDGQTSPIVLT